MVTGQFLKMVKGDVYLKAVSWYLHLKDGTIIMGFNAKHNQSLKQFIILKRINCTFVFNLKKYKLYTKNKRTNIIIKNERQINFVIVNYIKIKS